MKNNNLIMTIIIAVAVGIAGFFGGMIYQQNKTQKIATQQGITNVRGFARGQNAGRFGVLNRGMNGAFGEIVTIDANTLTIKMQDGSSKIVNLADTTTISKTDAASKTDLKTGEQVAIMGTTNSDGSITAQNVQLNPILRRGK